MFLENLDGIRFVEDIPKDNTPKKEMDKDAFLQLLVAQMKNQNPAEPMDNSEFVSQSAQFSALEQLINLSDKLDNLNNQVKDLSGNNQLLTASNFIGKEVRYMGNKTYFDGNQAEISFQVNNKPSKVEISLIDNNGKVITKLVSDEAVAGKNKVIWDGKNLDGKIVPEGVYAFQVDAYNESGKPITVNTYSEGIVSGVVNDAGTLKFNVDNNMVTMDQILSVNQVDSNGNT
ncbi:MAG: flagellar hook capping FlgD N-terminal domain-containing protein [Deferribacterota bacterium]|nr:flagellar hook capping FlgD N-terminal domain-containing protein [Deferribacterota bacterium]